ncbi:MAG: nitrilase-related carbon-nitrogen hydrolase [Planctomycetota bacterium]|jgi:predicted amidohydrolase|nr:nitrilase-related carbon-nitrogen hydrolase [Planctomycetota bacterium]MDP6940885.1 nitrilase-related carbon-nitrogen hydrolase [Planctomycetota bacterium]
MSLNCLAALCQFKPALGDLDGNLEKHHEWLDRAAKESADLVLFPELSLTGYFLRDLTQDSGLTLQSSIVQDLVSRSKDRSIVFGFIEESEDHRFFNSMLFAEDGKILHVHRKVHLPDYGIFEEGRYFAHGNSFDVVQSRLGRFGILTCEDAWHLDSAWLQFLQGVDAFLIPSASPARGIDTDAPELSSQTAWRTLNSAISLFMQSWVLHCNRVGFEDGAMYWGASSITSPFGYPVAEAPGEEEHLLLHSLSSDPIRRARTFTPLRRDARPDLVRLHLARMLQDPDALLAAEQGNKS